MDASEIKRQICEQIEALKSLKKIVVILGPRQVGKTTLLRQLTAGASSVLSFDCDNADERMALEGKSTTELAALI